MSRVVWVAIVGVIASMVAGIFIGRSTVQNPEPEVRVEVETIRITNPLPEMLATDRYEILYFELRDSVARLVTAQGDVAQPKIEIDSEGEPVALAIPMDDFVFTDNLTYRAVVSGYNVTMPEIEIFKETVYETKTVTYYPRWRLDAMYSMMYAQEQWQSAVGVCFDRKIFNRLYVGAYAMQGLKSGEISTGVVARFTILKK